MDAATIILSTKYNEPKVFDWEKAARIIKKTKTKTASAGLLEDWESTSGEIFLDGKPNFENNPYLFLSSTWATPILKINGKEFSCYRMKNETPGWGWSSDTYWPDEALVLLI